MTTPLQYTQDKIATEKYIRVGPYILTETIGSGATSKVKIAVHQGTKARFACKVMDKRNVRENTNSRHVRKEVNAMRLLDHRNVVSFKQVLTTSSKIYIIMELVEGSELFNEIRTYTRLSEPYARHFFTQLIDGLQHCHEAGVCHRDLKPENLMVTKDKILKITDFGLCNIKKTNGAGSGGSGTGGTGFMNSVTRSLSMRTQCGTPNFVAPEIVVLDEEHSPDQYSGSKVDIWACGVILFNLVAGHLPFNSAHTEELFHDIVAGDVPYPDWFSPSLVDLIGKMLEVDPTDRYTLKDIRAHDWFNEQSCRFNPTPPVADATELNPAHQFLSTVDLPRVSNSLAATMYTHPKNQTMQALTQGITYPGQEYQMPHSSSSPQTSQPGTMTVLHKQHTVDSLDFGPRLNTAEGELLSSHADPSTLVDANQQPTVYSPQDQNRLTLTNSILNRAILTSAASSHSRHPLHERQIGSASSSTGEDIEYESEELEDEEVYRCSHPRQVRFASDETGVDESLRRANFATDLSGSKTDWNNRQNVESLARKRSLSVGHAGMRGLVKRQLWNSALGFHSANGEYDPQPKMRRSSSFNSVDAGWRSARTGEHVSRHTHANSLITRGEAQGVYRPSVARSWNSLGFAENSMPSGKGHAYAQNEVHRGSNQGVDMYKLDDNKEWLRNEEIEAPRNRAANDFHLVSDSEEFNMDSWELNQKWTAGLKAEKLKRDSSLTKRAETRNVVRFAEFSEPANVREAQHDIMGHSVLAPIDPDGTRFNPQSAGVSHEEAYESARDPISIRSPYDQVGATAAPYESGEGSTMRMNDSQFPLGDFPNMPRAPPLSAVPAHMIREMLPPSRGVSPDRFSPNGRTTVGSKDICASFVSSLPSPHKGDTQAALPQSTNGTHGGRLYRPEKTPGCVKLGIGENFPSGTTSGAESLLTGSGGGSDRNARSSSSTGLSSEKTSSKYDVDVRDGLRGVVSNAPSQGATKARFANQDAAQLRAFQSSPDSTFVNGDDTPNGSSSPMTSDVWRQRETREEHSGKATSQFSLPTIASPDGNMDVDRQNDVQVSTESEPPLPRNVTLPHRGTRTLLSRLPGMYSARRQSVRRSSSRLETKSTTQFQTRIAPERCFNIIKEILIDHGCSSVKGGRPRMKAVERFTLRCEYKRAKANVVVVAKITISRFDEFLASVLFERQGRTSREHFEKFYTSVYNLFREVAYKDE